jgi:GMP synthase-like glutamine amidotransferase
VESCLSNFTLLTARNSTPKEAVLTTHLKSESRLPFRTVRWRSVRHKQINMFRYNFGVGVHLMRSFHSGRRKLKLLGDFLREIKTIFSAD